MGLHHNQLSGPIPKAFKSLINLQGLSLRFNQLTGSIPEFLGHLPHLERLDMNNNQLSGHIPSALFRIEFNVDISNNYLEERDGIPCRWGVENAFQTMRKPKMMTCYQSDASMDE